MNQQLRPLLKSIFIDRVTCVNEIKQYVIEEGLESRDTSPLDDQQRRQSIGTRDADGQYLTQCQNEPKILGFEE